MLVYGVSVMKINGAFSADLSLLHPSFSLSPPLSLYSLLSLSTLKSRVFCTIINM